MEDRHASPQRANYCLRQEGVQSSSNDDSYGLRLRLDRARESSLFMLVPNSDDQFILSSRLPAQNPSLLHWYLAGTASG
jgi:hypothetical protein